MIDFRYEDDRLKGEFYCPSCGEKNLLSVSERYLKDYYEIDHICQGCLKRIFFDVEGLAEKYEELKADKKEENIRRVEVELIKALITAKKRSKYMTKEILNQVDDVKNEIAFEDSYLRAGFRMSMLNQLEDIKYKLNGWLKVAGRHEEIAEKIGTDRVTLKKALARLIIDKTVEYNSEYIRLLDDVEE